MAFLFRDLPSVLIAETKEGGLLIGQPSICGDSAFGLGVVVVVFVFHFWFCCCC